MDEAPISAAHVKLNECDALVTRLSKMCCEPDRSPRLAAVTLEIDRARNTLNTITDDPSRVADLILRLESIGATIGELQVGCCAPARMPLYADTMVRLTEVQLLAKESVGIAH